MVLLELFFAFFVIGIVSFGGGYAMIPIIELEVMKQGWMTSQQFTDIIGLAGMSPGPIATNSAIFVGHHVAGIPGAIAAGFGMVLPSFLFVILISIFFYKMNDNKHVKSAFYGLRPIITALIVYAAIRFAIVNDVISPLSWNTVSVFFIFFFSLFALTKWKLHPVFVILLSGLVGIAIFS
ncbi:chromate transporter [Alkalihalobacterium bogoriense]|uniref:chromate transporter n=1 Tax=Alkalihalobacterium bogoriense TaxID=246272 RepID=UPI00047AB726|nr:chromate transporter [Alkalihalobacterium bogoriense]